MTQPNGTLQTTAETTHFNSSTPPVAGTIDPQKLMLDELATMRAEMARLRQQNEALQRQAAGERVNGLSFKVSEKGAVCVYGLGRWPTTLYLSQWEKLLSEENIAKLKEFINKNRSLLSVKEKESKDK